RPGTAQCECRLVSWSLSFRSEMFSPRASPFGGDRDQAPAPVLKHSALQPVAVRQGGEFVADGPQWYETHYHSWAAPAFPACPVSRVFSQVPFLLLTDSPIRFRWPIFHRRYFESAPAWGKQQVEPKLSSPAGSGARQRYFVGKR